MRDGWPPVHTPPALWDLLAEGNDREALGPFGGCPAVIVRCGPRPAGLADLLVQLPVVVIGVGEVGEDTGGCDVCLTIDAPGLPAPWVGAGGEPEEAAAVLAGTVAASPGAAVALVQLLRHSDRRSVLDGLFAESLAYGLLQGGAAHRAWMAAQPVRHHRPSSPGELPVLVERQDASVVVRLHRPEVRNAFDAATRDALVEVLDAVAIDPTIERVILRGDGPHFCAGGDLAEFGAVTDPVAGHLVRMTRSVAARLAALSVRVTAEVHGACVGAGVELPAYAAQVKATPDATFRLPEVAMGLVPGAGGTVSVPRRVGRERATWLALSGAALDAPTALAWGLIDEIA